MDYKNNPEIDAPDNPFLSSSDESNDGDDPVKTSDNSDYSTLDNSTRLKPGKLVDDVIYGEPTPAQVAAVAARQSEEDQPVEIVPSRNASSLLSTSSTEVDGLMESVKISGETSEGVVSDGESLTTPSFPLEVGRLQEESDYSSLDRGVLSMSLEPRTFHEESDYSSLDRTDITDLSNGPLRQNGAPAESVNDDPFSNRPRLRETNDYSTIDDDDPETTKLTDELNYKRLELGKYEVYEGAIPAPPSTPRPNTLGHLRAIENDPDKKNANRKKRKKAVKKKVNSTMSDSETVVYTIQVTTADEKYAATDAPVTMVMYGDIRDSGTLQLLESRSSENTFLPGQIDVFTFEIPHLGIIERIELTIDPEMAKYGPDWKCDKLLVCSDNEGDPWTFEFDVWFSNDENESVTHTSKRTLD
eukprot:m.119418 g.119418  ORF g.119418 m.119418 type:complete len:415 (+) comp14315_c0_seq3:248-1492(+)